VTRGQVRASQLLLGLQDDREEVAEEYRTSFGDERRDLANLGAVLDQAIKNLKHIGAEEWMGEVGVDVISIPLLPGER